MYIYIQYKLLYKIIFLLRLKFFNSPIFRNKPLLLVHGFQRDDKINLQSEASDYDNIRLCHANMPIPYGTHHRFLW